MNNIIEGNQTQAIENFHQARRQAVIDKLTASLTGRPLEMLPFDPVRTELRQQNPFYRGLQEIPLDLIVGSVGRYREFTRRFMPLSDNLVQRWTNIDLMAEEIGWPPIDAYLVGGVFFANDGNHRVSVARYLEMNTIEAYVWEYPVSVKINPDDTLDDVLIRLGQQNFVEKTKLNKLFPDHTIEFTTPGRYAELLAQIHDFQQKLAIIDDTAVSYEDAVAAWYEMKYLPTVQIIKDSTLLEDFPGRTEADLYAWLSLYHDKLGEIYGDYENFADLAQILADHHKKGSIKQVTRRVRHLLGHHELPPLAPIIPNSLST
ncbi:MAG: hypothetical protein KC413_09795 [Anaerolineales bacterium]|nr:hypothetical protein [Anaerolineales bacterium]